MPHQMLAPQLWAGAALAGQDSGRTELAASRHAPVMVVVLWGVCPHLGCSSKNSMFFKARLKTSPRAQHVPGPYGEERQGGASRSDVGVKEAFQGDQL